MLPSQRRLCRTPLNRVLIAFKKEAVAAAEQMGQGAPGEIVNAFLWVSRDASTSGGDMARYTSDWIIFTEFRACFGRKSRFLRKDDYRVLTRMQVSTIEVDVVSLSDSKDLLHKPCTFVSLQFTLADGTSLLRHIYVERTDVQNSPALIRVRERLARIRSLGWPLVEGRSWDAIPIPQPDEDDDDEMASESH